MKLVRFLVSLIHGCLAEINAWEGSLSETILAYKSNRRIGLSFIHAGYALIPFVLPSILIPVLSLVVPTASASGLAHLLNDIFFLLLSWAILLPFVVDTLLIEDLRKKRQVIIKGEVLKILLSQHGGCPVLINTKQGRFWAHISRANVKRLEEALREGRVDVTAKMFQHSHFIYEIEGLSVKTKQKVAKRVLSLAV